MSLRAERLPSIAALTRTATHVEPLTGVGFSGANLFRVRTADGAFVLKRSRPDAEFTARRTNDRHGREAMLLAEEALADVWECFECPYAAYAIEVGEIGLLLHDLSDALLPDVRAPLTDSQEHLITGALARMHARFWDRVPAREWLARPADYCDLLAPCAVADAEVFPPPVRDGLLRGWKSALARLPDDIAELLTSDGAEWEQRWAHLPQTFIHGDVKVANFAITIDGRVCAFDWALAGTGPCTIDLGWYIAINASRLAFSKEMTIRRYRNQLEFAMEKPIPGDLWRELEDVAVICGARMLLWSKALALDTGREGAREEWDWWVGRLGRLTR